MAIPDYVFPTREQFKQIDQDLYPVVTLDDPIFTHFPVTTTEEDVLRWEQRDNYTGLQQIRGLDGQPPKVSRVGGKGFLMQPGVYGEQESVPESELTKRRLLGTYGDRYDATEATLDNNQHLMSREYSRIRQVLWALVTTGTFSVLTRDGQVAQTDTFPIQTFTAVVPWATKATATPLADERAVKLLARGHSVDFGSKAIAYGNQVTINNALGNTNANDLFGKRGPNGSTFNSLTADNQILLENGLPILEMFDDGYLNDAKTFVPFIPDNVVVVIGMRPNNQPVGEYRKTYNATADGGESYAFAVDSKELTVPRTITSHRGHSGGPVIYFPSAIVVMSV